MMIINWTTLPKLRGTLRTLSFRDRTAVLFMATCEWLFERWVGVFPEDRDGWKTHVIMQAERIPYREFSAAKTDTKKGSPIWR